MQLTGGDEALELARRVVVASPAHETEVTVESERDAFVRFADQGPTQNADRLRSAVAIRVRTEEPGGGVREARAECGTLEEADWQAALRRALELADASPVREACLPLGGPVEVRPALADAATLEQSFEAKARWVQLALQRAEEARLRPAGLVRTNGRALALANSAGRAVHGSQSRASFALTLTGDTGSGLGQSFGARVEDVDPDVVIGRAVRKAQASERPQACEPGEYTVVLEPLAVSSILLFAGYCGFGAREVDERSSFLCDRIGELLFPASLSVFDDAAHPRLPALTFDGEGNPRQRVNLIERGRLGSPVTDRQYAAKLGLPCTGHAVPQPSQDGPSAKNLVVQAGQDSVEELVRGVERGVLVTQFHYTNMIEPRELTLTGMTRNGTFLIEGGEVARPVKNLRFTDTLVRALGAVSGVGAEQETAGARFDGEMLTPALRIDGFRFTSATDF